MAYKSVNPYNGDFLKSYNELSNIELLDKIDQSVSAYSKWKDLPIFERLKYLPRLSELLSNQLDHHASLITFEMGKPIKQSKAEIEKCITACKYYYENAEALLKPQKHESLSNDSFVIFQPIGIVYGIMPWNFPYWQVLRFLIPNLILGNAVFLKHASNVPQCAEALESLILEAGFPKGIFQNLFINYEQSELVIGNKNVRGITFTGSEAAGSKVAALAGKNIKKSVLELGGSDPFIVLKDANMQIVIDQAVFARMQNTGQSCIAAKRFFVHEDVYQVFLEGLTKKINDLRVADPMDMETEIGPMAAEYLLTELDNQVQRSISAGGKLVTGGKRLKEGTLFYEPTIIETSNIDIPVCYEETFGPVAVVISFSDTNKMIEMANSSSFGLGASVWSKNASEADYVANKIESGMVSINGIVKSDAALAFGGTKSSGYGRELADYGLKEFSNIKTITQYY